MRNAFCGKFKKNIQVMSYFPSARALQLRRSIVPCKYIRQFLPPAKENRPIKAKQKICMCERAKMFPRNWQGKNQ
jgi:hypothetical protein